eukprot:jgi/Ulvmu1/3998/UM185_0004.1
MGAHAERQGAQQTASDGADATPEQRRRRARELVATLAMAEVAAERLVEALMQLGPGADDCDLLSLAMMPGLQLCARASKVLALVVRLGTAENLCEVLMDVGAQTTDRDLVQAAFLAARQTRQRGNVSQSAPVAIDAAADPTAAAAAKDLVGAPGSGDTARAARAASPFASDPASDPARGMSAGSKLAVDGRAARAARAVSPCAADRPATGAPSGPEYGTRGRARRVAHAACAARAGPALLDSGRPIRSAVAEAGGGGNAAAKPGKQKRSRIEAGVDERCSVCSSRAAYVPTGSVKYKYGYCMPCDKLARKLRMETGAACGVAHVRQAYAELGSAADEQAVQRAALRISKSSAVPRKGRKLSKGNWQGMRMEGRSAALSAVAVAQTAPGGVGVEGDAVKVLSGDDDRLGFDVDGRMDAGAPGCGGKEGGAGEGVQHAWDGAGSSRSLRGTVPFKRWTIRRKRKRGMKGVEERGGSDAAGGEVARQTTARGTGTIIVCGELAAEGCAVYAAAEMGTAAEPAAAQVSRFASDAHVGEAADMLAARPAACDAGVGIRAEGEAVSGGAPAAAPPRARCSVAAPVRKRRPYACLLCGRRDSTDEDMACSRCARLKRQLPVRAASQLLLGALRELGVDAADSTLLQHAQRAKRAQRALSNAPSTASDPDHECAAVGVQGADVERAALCWVCFAEPKCGRCAYCGRCDRMRARVGGRGSVRFLRAAVEELGADAEAKALIALAREKKHSMGFEGEGGTPERARSASQPYPDGEVTEREAGGSGRAAEALCTACRQPCVVEPAGDEGRRTCCARCVRVREELRAGGHSGKRKHVRAAVREVGADACFGRLLAAAIACACRSKGAITGGPVSAARPAASPVGQAAASDGVASAAQDRVDDASPVLAGENQQRLPSQGGRAASEGPCPSTGATVATGAKVPISGLGKVSDGTGACADGVTLAAGAADLEATRSVDAPPRATPQAAASSALDLAAPSHSDGGRHGADVLVVRAAGRVAVGAAARDACVAEAVEACDAAAGQAADMIVARSASNAGHAEPSDTDPVSRQPCRSMQGALRADDSADVECAGALEGAPPPGAAAGATAVDRGRTAAALVLPEGVVQRSQWRIFRKPSSLAVMTRQVREAVE